MPSISLKYRKDLKQKSQKNRKAPTEAELLLWRKVLSRDQAGHRFLRQKPIESYIVDFYCHKLKIAIELDGDQHANNKDYDSRRTSSLEEKGIKVLRYSNRDVLLNLEGVYEDIMRNI